MVVVEPVVNEEKVRQLLDEQAESDVLDYKERLDLRERRDEVELAKDIAAMQMRGGYVVIGADSRGRLTGRFTEAEARLFDEARVRQKLVKYLAEPLTLMAAWHVIDGHPVAIVYTGQHRDCFAILRADGQWRNDKGQDIPVFRQGDVFARHGTRSERWSQEDVEAIRRCQTEKDKESWRREFAEEIARIETGTLGRRLASGAAGSLTWRVDDETFGAAVVELLRVDDRVPLQLLARRLPIDARALVSDEDGRSEFETLLDRTSCLAAIAEVLSAGWLVDAAVDALRRIYVLGHGERVGVQLAIQPAELWLQILLRAYALGALSVRDQNWGVVRRLALQAPEPGDGRTQYFSSWIRHGLTMAARSGKFSREEDGRKLEISLLSLARDVVRREACLRPDVAAEDEAVLDSLCQFDALASLAAIGASGSVDTRHFYTSFARFYTRRTEPVISRLLTDTTMRSAIFPREDNALADALRAIDSMARSEGFRYAGWEGFSDAAIRNFLEAHPPQGAKA